MPIKLVLPLKLAVDIELVGGKAQSLCNLLRGGFRTQDGFVITTAAFGAMTTELKKEIFENFDKLKTKFVAVRSSATTEDSSEATWAGQLDTFLNVSRDDLIETIQKSWDAIKSTRAISYAKAKNLQAGKVAVIIQPMQQSDVAGIVFSVHPVTKNRAQIIIEAGMGLGEAVVSGEITPDTYIINKSTSKILEKHISKQTKKLVQGKSGKSEWQKVRDGSKQKLSDEKIIELTSTILRLENYYGFAIDVEWLMKDNLLYIMQSRPITTL